MYNADLQRAIEAMGSSSYAEMHRLLEPLVRHRVPAALALSGLAYQLGLGIAADGVTAAMLLREASELGDGTAAHNLGSLYVGGCPGVEPDIEAARKWYRLAWDLGAVFGTTPFEAWLDRK